MILEKEFIDKHGLNEDVVKAIAEIVTGREADLKKGWDGKANADAEAIIEGAAKKVYEVTGIQRDKGQKIGDYLTFASTQYVNSSLAVEKAKLDAKLKELNESGGDKVIKKEYDDLKEKYEGLQKKEAEYDKLVQGNYKTLYEELSGKITQTETTNAFLSVKPNFPDSVNKFEAAAKWNSFVDTVKEKYNIKIDDKGEALVVDKDNEYKVSKLSDLVSKNDEIQALVKGREQKGLGHTKATETIEGVPFKVDPQASSQERQQQIKEYLTGELKLNVISDEYAKKFAELNIKLKQKTAT